MYTILSYMSETSYIGCYVNITSYMHVTLIYV